MNFGFEDRTIHQPNGREPLQLPPVAASEALLESSKVADSVARRNDIDESDRADDLERIRAHSDKLPGRSVRDKYPRILQPAAYPTNN